MLGDRHPVRRHVAAFGRRAFLADLADRLRASRVVIYLLFAKLLTLSLPAGPLERLI